ncbi:hypothetical protein [Kitasatospora azatica]|uniref:hypothetical protein n=1 Tax=Kitasatospora azatica TaxID=58347 RepID=UPI00068B5772|nr:hypothetical protein [Kitasatospora azatica]
MGIGMLALYAALAVVALWLIAELLLQNRAPLHWRAVALGGFLLVVAGMAIRSVPVIGVGAAAFAAGQVFVTLSVKHGYRDGWSLRRADGALPGPLAKVPLLAAATSGVAAAAVVAEQERVGEVGPVEEADPEGGSQFPAGSPESGAEEEDYGVYETVASYQEQPQLPEQVAYPYAEQQQYDYQQYGYYEQQQYVPYEPQWQQQYDPSQGQGQGQPQYQYGIPQQQSYEYYQPQPMPESEQPVQPVQPQQQPQAEQHWQTWQ